MPPTGTVEIELIAGAVKGSPSTSKILIIAENLGSWQNSMEIIFSGYEKDETLTDFPALVVFEESENRLGFSYSEFLSPPYDDLRFSSDDKITQLGFEVESWDSEGKSFVWVKIPELIQNTKIYAFWGKDGAEAPLCTTDGSVWSDNFLGVWHMNDSIGTTIEDSTRHRFNGTKKAENSPMEIDAVIGKGQKFDSTYINLTGLIGAGDRVCTISTWLNSSSAAADLYVIDIPTGNLLIQWRTLSPSPELNKWHHAVFCYGQGELNTYLNGSKYGETQAHDNKTIGGATAIGSRHTYFNRNYFPGMMDEFRISTTIRSPDWVWACYENQGNHEAFVSYGDADVQILKGTIYSFW